MSARPTLVLLIGLPASGKSTFFRERFADSHVHVSKDNFPNAKNRAKRQARLIEEALSQGRSVVVDNTNASRAERAPVIEQARAHDAEVVGYSFSSRLADVLARNAGRSGAARVPNVGIFAIAKRLQRPDPSEGFDALWYVTIEGSGFKVAPWQDTPDEDERT